MNINAIAFCGPSHVACAGPGSETAIVGDDYESDWPYLVAQHFNAEITCHGIHGVNFYHSVQRLFGLDPHYTTSKTFDETDLVIFVMPTSTMSIINRNRTPMYYWLVCEAAKGNPNPAGISNEKMSRYREEVLTTEEITKNAVTVKDYLENIVDWQSLEVMQRALTMFVDEKMVSMNKKAIWFPSSNYAANKDIPGWCGKWSPKSGPIGNIPLRFISAAESDSVLRAEDTRRNHLSPEGNKKFAEMIIDTIERDPELKPGTLDMKPWFPDVDESKWQQIDHQGPKQIGGELRDRSTRAMFNGYPPDYPFVIP